jgi:hypothetical protein
MHDTKADADYESASQDSTGTQTDTPDLDIDPEQRLVDALEQIRTAAIALEAREDVVLHYYADQAIDPVEQAVATIQKREGTTGRTQDGDAA